MCLFIESGKGVWRVFYKINVRDSDRLNPDKVLYKFLRTETLIPSYLIQTMTEFHGKKDVVTSQETSHFPFTLNHNLKVLSTGPSEEI